MKLRSIAPRSRRLCNRCGTRNRVAQPGCVILLCVLGERGSFAGVDRLKIFLRFPLSAKERIKDNRIVESISRKRGKSLEKYIFFFTRAHNCHHLCEFLQEFLHVSFHGLHCKFVSEKLFRPDTFGPMQKLFPLIKLPRQLSPGSGAFVSFSSLQRDRSMHNYNVKKK